MKKIILLLLSIIVISCNEKTENNTIYNYEEFGHKLTGELNLLGENLRSKNNYFNNPQSVEKALHEVFGDNSSISKTYSKNINNFNRKYKRRTLKENTIKTQNILLSKIKNLLLKSKTINEYKNGLSNLFNELKNKDIENLEKHKKLIYLKTQITFIEFISSNSDLFPPPTLSSETYSKRFITPIECQRDIDCPRGMICCQGYCRYPTASDMCPAWLGTVWGVAIVEPTPVGEAVAGTVSGIVAGYYILTRAECIAEYVNCKYRNDKDCSTCLQYCIVQGRWCN